MTTEKTYTMEELDAMHTALVHADMFIKEQLVTLSNMHGADSIVKCIEQIENTKFLVWNKLYPLKYPPNIEAA